MDMENGLWGKLNRISDSLDTLRTSLHLSDDASIEDLAHLENLLNIYVQEEEPERKEGIWLRTESKGFTDVIVDNDAIAPGIWYTNNDYGVAPWYLKDYEVSNYGTFAVVGDYLYYFGGKKSTPCKYNFITQTFTNIKSAIDYNLVGTAAVVVGTDVYLFGGCAGSSIGNVTSRAWKYDTLTDTYTNLCNLPDYRFAMNGCLVDNDIYLFGGNRQINLGISNNNVWKYSIADNTYTTLTNYPNGNGSSGYVAYASNMGVVPFGRKIYLFGGRWSSETIQGYMVYDIDTNQFSAYKKISGLYNACPPAIIGTRVYFFSAKDTPVIIFDLTTEEVITTDIIIPKSYGCNGAYFYKDKIYLPSLDSLDVLTIKGSEYDNNAVVLVQNNNADSVIATELITVPHFINRMRLRFSDAFYYSKDDGLDTTIPTYYGDGSQWIKFKN